MIYGSLFSGIEGASVAWAPLGWRCAWVAETDPFPSGLLAHRYPQVPNLGDVERIDAGTVEPVDLVVFGSPCQSFSVAGKRLGLDDPRGNMALVGLRVVGKLRPRWVVWENVPGVLSSDGGRDFGAFLGLLGELGYGFAYRVLDAQHFGVPQRRRRVFVVGCLGDWRPAAAVLFEPESLRWDSPPRRQAGERIARPVASCAPGGSGYRADADTADNLIAFSAKDHGADAGETAPTLRAGGHDRSHANAGVMPAICHALRADGFDASEDGTGRGTPLVAVPIQSVQAVREKRQNGIGIGQDGDPMFTQTGRDQHAVMTLAIRGRGDSHDLEYREDGIANAILTPTGGRAGIGVGAVAFDITGTGPGVRNGGAATDIHTALRSRAPGGSEASTTTVVVDTTQITSAANRSQPQPGDPCHPLAATAHPPLVAGMSVRRLTPRECLRLQGFPDDYLDIQYRGKPAADGPKYRAIGNSFAVPVVRYIGQRIQAFEDAAS